MPERELALAEAQRVLRPGGRIAVFDGDYATTTMARNARDPLQSCAAAVLAMLVHDPWLMRRIAPLLEHHGFKDAELRGHSYVSSTARTTSSRSSTAAPTRSRPRGRSGSELAAALKAEGRARMADAPSSATSATSARWRGGPERRLRRERGGEDPVVGAGRAGDEERGGQPRLGRPDRERDAGRVEEARRHRDPQRAGVRGEEDVVVGLERVDCGATCGEAGVSRSAPPSSRSNAACTRGRASQQRGAAARRERAALAQAPQDAAVEARGIGRVEQRRVRPPRLVGDEQAVGAQQRGRLRQRGDRAALDVRAGGGERLDRGSEGRGHARIDVVDGLALGDEEPRPPTPAAGTSAAGTPRSAASSAIRSATVVASGPTLSSDGASGSTPARSTRATDGLKPAIPQNAAGTRIEPDVSVPIAHGTTPAATATAEPDEEPPGARAGSSGFGGVPDAGSARAPRTRARSGSSCRRTRAQPR